MVPGLVPLGSTWFHDALDALFTAFWLGSCLVPLGSSCERFGFYSTWAWFHDAATVNITTFKSNLDMHLSESDWCGFVVEFGLTDLTEKHS